MYNVDTSDKGQPLECKSFNSIPKDNLPYCLLGHEIKDLYDQKYFNINKKYNPVDIVHFSKFPSVQPIFLRGLQFTPNTKLQAFIDDILRSTTNKFGEMSTKRYLHLTSLHDLQCNYSLNSLCDGVYPLDSENINTISNLKPVLSNLYNEMFDKNLLSSFLKLRYYRVYILTDTGVNFK